MFDVQRRGKRRSDEWGRRDASPLRRSVAVSMVFEIAHGRVINKLPTALPQGAMRQPLAEGLLNDVASGKLSSDAFANRKLITIAVSSRMTQSPNRIRYFGAARSAVENLPRA